jgi:hypothetical protein
MDSQRQDRGHRFLPPPEVLSQIPGARQTESTAAEDKTIWLHYFSAASDHYIAEAWQEPESQGEPDRWMGFGYARFAAFPDLAEWGYIDLDELEQVRVEGPGGLPVIVERDLAWQPKPFREIQPEAAGAPTARQERSPAGAKRDRQPTAQARQDAADGRVAPGPQHQGERLHSGAQLLTLDQEQAATVMAALDDAAALRREAIGNCPDCRSADERICVDHQGSWEAADDYDQLRWQLEANTGGSNSGYRADPAAAAGMTAEPTAAAAARAEDQARAETARAEAEDIQHDEPGWTEQRADVAPSREHSGLAPDAHVMRLGPPPSMQTRWDAENAADAGPGERQILTRNEASDYQNDAYDCDGDREAGE